MIDSENKSDSVSFPALLRVARRTFGVAIREALAQAGCDDVPRNGIFALGAIARTGAPLSQIIKEMGVSKQAAGQLVDTLVLRGYLDRVTDSQDRRRLTVTLTQRGREAATVSRAAVERIEAQLVAQVGAESVSHTRATLAALGGFYQDVQDSD